MSDDERSEIYDPRAGNQEPEKLPTELIPLIAKRAKGKHDGKGEYIPPVDKSDRSVKTLRELLDAAIEGKLVTVAQIGETLGPKAVEVAKGKNPDPKSHRALIDLLAGLTP